MKYLLVIIFVWTSLGVHAQHEKKHVDHLVAKFTKSLEARNITNYMYLYEYCDGIIDVFRLSDGTSCSSKGTYYEVYVFWNEDNRSLVKKIDNCGIFFALPINNINILNYISTNIQQLQVQVKQYELESTENQVVEDISIHPCQTMFQFNVDDQSFGQTYNLFQLTTDASNKNINFDYNNNLKIVALENLLNEEIQSIESKFRREL